MCEMLIQRKEGREYKKMSNLESEESKSFTPNYVLQFKI